MTTRMLIDARHPEETRVVVVKGNRIEEFDFEAASRKQIKGNIYLAKVTRVEPSLQAAFIDYGGNRHGFLAFSEIHPDYYQIPKEDREALLREEQRLGDDQADLSGGQDGNGGNGGIGGHGGNGQDAEPDDGEAGPEEHGASDDAAAEALRRRRMQLRRRYRIQDVIRRRQVMLVQAVKEERGNKGAALTTYISLAGRYGVLMPNTAQGGGISRKIANAADRKRLKSIIADLKLPATMGAIVRTAGVSRTRTEIRRDFDYLTRLWDEIREKTLASTAPTLIYEDNDLIKRAIRDIYTREIDEVLVDGEAGYRQARAFMKLLMPSHARKVQHYSDPVPLFLRAGVEGQLAAMMNPVVQLKSGGYMVISPTEALVAVDVNSGRSTREHNIEETALRTNIEAAEEVARQLRLRDMAGLIVVDFIDMEVSGNNRKVEKALKDALKADRARVQVGRISPFGLLEMSRQRLRTGVLEASTEPCPHCGGSGLVRTESSAALSALRLVEEEAVKGRASQFRLRSDPGVAIYILNRKRIELAELEARYGIHVEVAPDPTLTGARLAVEASGPPPSHAPQQTGLPAPAVHAEDEDEGATEADEADPEAEDEAGATEPSAAEPGQEERREGRKRKRRRRGGRGRRARGEAGDGVQAQPGDSGDPGDPGDPGGPGATRATGGTLDPGDAPLAPAGDDRAVEAAALPAAPADEPVDASPPSRPARRGRGRVAAPVAGAGPAAAPDAPPADPAPGAVELADAPEAPRPRRRARATPAAVAEMAPGAGSGAAESAAPARPRRTRRGAAAPAGPETAPADPVGAAADGAAAAPVAAPPAAPAEVAPAPAPAPAEPAAEAPRRGWWQRTFGG